VAIACEIAYHYSDGIASAYTDFPIMSLRTPVNLLNFYVNLEDIGFSAMQTLSIVTSNFYNCKQTKPLIKN